uniref:Nuclear pore complex protein Nup205 n=1 Tax=Parascaris univalens TaxID=6257 RepID=A0A915BZ70_PARUN
MWLRARHIYEQLNKFIDANGNVDETEARELLDLLSANKALFTNILKNAGRSAAHRSQLEPNKVVKLPSGHTVHVDPEIRNEAIVISDTFNCDELDALELISTGEAQSQHFYYWTRGLCAIVCYYDTHRLLSVTTKALVQMKVDDGMQLMPAMSAFLTQFCASASLAKRLIEVTQMNLDSELHMLHHPSVNGIGGSKHQQILCTLIEETITNCRDTLYMLCSSWDETDAPPFLSDLLTPLKQLAPTSSFTTSHLCVWTAVLMLISPQSMRRIQSVTPILGALRKEFVSSWPDMCVLASLQFASIVSYTWVNASRSSLEDDDFTLLDNDDISSLLKKALNAMVFSFLRCSVVRSPGFRNDAAAFETLDTLVKLFITYFPDKLVLLRRTCEEELSSVDLSLGRGFVPELPLHFEKFLRLIADLYDSNSRIVSTAAAKFLSPDSPALGKFLKSGKEILSPVLQITYLDMLKNLCKNKAVANFIFRLLSSSYGATADTISFAHFCWAIRGYVDAFRKKRVPQATADRAFKMKLEVVLSQEEVAGLVAWTQLAEVIALQDPYACRQFASDEMFMMDPLVGLLGTSIPLVLKGTFYRFLSVLARDGITARKIWTLLKSHSVLTTAPDGKLLGIQQELDERECAVRSYDSTLGFLHLMRALMLHPTSTFDDGRLLPYLRFLMKSVVSQFAYRSYEQEDQMWELCSLSCDTLCNLLKYYVVTDASLLGSHLQVAILTQVLSKSPVFRSMAGVLVQGSGHLESGVRRCASLETACLSVLRLLRTCILQHANLAEAIRSSSSNLIIASLDSLLLDRLSAGSEATGIAAIATFIMQHELLPLHAYWAAQILRDLCASRPTLQGQIVFCLKPLGKGFVEQCARMASPRITSLALSPIDPPVLYDVDYLPDSRIRAETARILIELCTTSIEMDPHKPNMGYFLCGFDMVDLSGSRLENPGINDTTRTVLHSVLDALEDLVNNVRPYAVPFCALFEPMLRLLLRLVHADTSCGELVLRFLRSNYDLVFRLLCSCAVLAPCSPSDGEDSVVFENMQRMIQGYVLHLCAVEMSSLLKIRHYSQPARLYCMLLSSDGDMLRDATSSLMSSTDQTSTAAREEGSSITFCSGHHSNPQQSFSNLDAAQESTSSTISHNGRLVAAQVTSSSLSANFTIVPPTSTQRETAGDRTALRASVPWTCIDNREDRLLWKFLRLAKVQFSLPRKPHLEMFNSGKLCHMASLCERLSTSNVEQCDIERMHFLLQREALSVIGELQEQGIGNVANEVHELLRYCVAYNLLQGTRASSRQLLSGWLSVVNVMAGFVPVPFMSPRGLLLILIFFSLHRVAVSIR